MKAKSKSQKRMTEAKAKELEKQELRNNSAQATATPVEVTPVEPEAPVEIISDPGEDAIDKAVAEQQALLDARLQKEADEKAEADIAAHEAKGNFTFTAFIQFKHYVKISADTEEEALEKISQLKLDGYINKKDVRLDKKK